MRNLLSYILHETWFIDEQYALSQLPLITALRAGDNTIYVGEFAQPTFAASSNNNGTSKKKVAIIPLNGPILKDDGFCGEPGALTIANWIKAADNDPEVAAIIVNTDTPGGAGNGATLLAEAARNCSKPIIAHIAHGMAASAGYWFASQCDEIYCQHPHDRVGSIGAYCVLADNTGELEAKGWKVKTIYAPQSTNKNGDYRRAMDGDESGIQQWLGDSVATFIADVKKGRGARLKGEQWTDGSTYNASQAKKIGLIDGIQSMEASIGRALKLSSSSKSNNMTSTKYDSIAAVVGWAEGYETTEDGIFLQHEEAAKVEEQLANATALSTTIAAQAEENSAKDATIASLTTQLADATALAKSWEAKATALAAQPAADITTPVGGDKNDTPSPQAEYDSVTLEAMAVMKQFNRK